MLSTYGPKKDGLHNDGINIRAPRGAPVRAAENAEAKTAMLDEKSLMVTYKDWRGEPRGSVKKAQKDPEHFGDCVDCLQCVAVCPTGIDIREGPQIGCITCALCIDACDKVMADVGRPRTGRGAPSRGVRVEVEHRPPVARRRRRR